MKTINNTVFETLLLKNDLRKIDFSNYSQIPYDTVTGWKKHNKVPPYAMVILKDMIYRKKLDKEVTDILDNSTNSNLLAYNLTKQEENRLKSLFWGTNFTTGDIVKGVREKNPKILKRIKDNLPTNLQNEIC